MAEGVQNVSETQGKTLVVEPILLEASDSPHSGNETPLDTVAPPLLPSSKTIFDVPKTSYEYDLNLVTPSLYQFDTFALAGQGNIFFPFVKQQYSKSLNGLALDWKGNSEWSEICGTETESNEDATCEFLPSKNNAGEINLTFRPLGNFALGVGYKSSRLDSNDDGLNDELLKASLSFTKYRNTPQGPDLQFPAYQVSLFELEGIHQYKGGVSGSVLEPKIFLLGSAYFMSARTDSDFYFDDFFTDKQLIPESAEVRNTVNGKVDLFLNPGAPTDAKLEKVAFQISGSGSYSADKDDSSEDGYQLSAGTTFHFPLMRTDLTLRNIADGDSPLFVKSELSYLYGHFIDGWKLPSTGDSIDPFTGVAYDPLFYRGEEDLVPLNHDSMSMPLTIAAGGKILSSELFSRGEHFRVVLTGSAQVKKDLKAPNSPLQKYLGFGITVKGRGQILSNGGALKTLVSDTNTLRRELWELNDKIQAQDDASLKREAETLEYRLERFANKLELYDSNLTETEILELQQTYLSLKTEVDTLKTKTPAPPAKQ